MDSGNKEQTEFSGKRDLPRGRHSLKYRIVALALFCSISSALAIGGFGYFELRRTARDQAYEKFQAETRLMAIQFEHSYERISDDLITVSNTPPLAGIYRSNMNDGIDPFDGSSLELWKQRLSTIFTSVMRNRPEYFQFRLIGVGNGGREIVRVDRTVNGIVVTHEDNLQKKGKEDYFQFALSAPKNEISFSKVTYNREFGRVDPELTPALRGIFPIEDPHGNRFAMLVINVNYEIMLRQAFETIKPPFHTIAANRNADFMEYDTHLDGVSNFQLGTDTASVINPAVKEFLDQDKPAGHFNIGDTVAFFVGDTGRYNQQSANLGLIVQVPQGILYAHTVGVGNRVIAVGLAILFVCGVAVSIAGRRFITPLIHFANVMQERSETNLIKRLPADRADEIGYLAHAIRQKIQALLDSEARARMIAENVANGVILTDQTGKIEEFNPGSEQIFGYSYHEIVGQNVLHLLDSKDASKKRAFIKLVLSLRDQDNLEGSFELEAMTKLGEPVLVELCVKRLILDGQLKYICVVRDLSERQEVTRMRNEFVSTVSHELRTPITSIRGSLALALNLGPTDNIPGPISKMLTLAQKNTERLTHLVNDILNFEKLRKGKSRFQPQASDLNDEIAMAVAANSLFAEEHHIRLLTQPCVDAPLAMVDKKQLQKVLGHLITNAVKFSEPGGAVDLRITVSDTAVRLYVVDTGAGIPKSFQPKVFNAFSQADGSSSRETGGAGLGLNIAKELVEGMGGKISFSSEEGVGTTFCVEFPTLKNTDLLKTAQPQRIGPFIGLHLDADSIFTEALQIDLENHVDFIPEATIAGAMSHIDKRAFDVLVLDVDIEGDKTKCLELLDALKNPDATAVIALTRIDEEFDHPAVDEAIIKSRTKPGELISLVVGLLEEKQKHITSHDPKTSTIVSWRGTDPI